MPRISALPPASRAAGENELPMVNKEAATTQKATVDMLMPTGTILDFAGSSAPDGFLMCYGQALDADSNPEYQALYDVIGNAYGGSDNSDFVVPDLRGRVAAGKDDMGGSSANRLTDQSGGVNGDVLGDTGGAETHTLLTAEMPAHTHTTVVSRDVSPGSGLKTPWSDGSASNARQTTSTGGGGAHNNVQPTIILNKIIKY